MKSSEKFSEILKVRVSLSTKQDLQRLANEAGMNEAEYLRNLIMIHIYGEQEVLNIHRERLELIASRGKS